VKILACSSRENIAMPITESPAHLGHIAATDTIRVTEPNTKKPFRRFGSFAIVYLLAGSGRYEDESGAECDLRAGDLIIVKPQLGHRYGPDSCTEWVERYVVFEGPVFDLWESSGWFDMQPPVIRLEPVHAWNAAIDHVLGERLGAVSPLEQVCRLQGLLARILDSRLVMQTLSNEDREWLSAACSLLDTGDPAMGSTLDLPDVAANLSLSYDGFRKRFRRLSGVSPARYRTLQRIDRARRLVQQGILTNREIAETLGFCDEQHFSRRFKQVTGKSPRGFRRSLPISVPGSQPG
jgi:AraC-like DNA-binding protein